MHVPYKKIWSGIPDNVKSILSLSKHLCVELRLTDPETQRNLSACRYLPKNETLKTVLPKELYIRVLRYLIQVQELFPNWLFGKGGVDGFSKVQSDRLFYSMIGDYENLRPVWLLMLLSSLSRENVQERNIPLLDVFLDRAADGVGKSVEAIEVYKEQCRPFNKLNETKVRKRERRDREDKRERGTEKQRRRGERDRETKWIINAINNNPLISWS